MALVIQHVSFTYDDSPAEIVHDLSAHFPAGWTGVVGANGSGKSTVLRLAAGLLVPTHGTVRGGEAAIYLPQRTDDAPSRFDEFAEDYSAEAHVLRRHLRIGDDWPARWHSLSHGERKRAQLAVVLWQRPDLLAVDEPTNHLDEEARRRVRQALHEFAGVGILVSHDRLLLDGLCRQCLFLDAREPTMRPGGYTEASRQRAQESEAARRKREQTEAEIQCLRRVQVSRLAQADQSRAKRSAKVLARHDSDGRAKRQLAVVSGKDGQSGRLLAQLDGRLQQAQERLAAMPIEKIRRRGIWLSGARSSRRTLVSLPAGSLTVGERRLVHPNLTLGPCDRIALTGRNGAGKTTLLRRLLGELTLPPERIVYVPQEISAEQCASLLDLVKASDDATLGRLLTVVSRLGSFPDRVLDSQLPSPGETRKLMLALGVLREPHIVIMDEPTNHLDPPAVECLEAALAETPCALLLVSHDRAFLGRLCTVEWRLAWDRGETQLRPRPMSEP
ncbi:MAG: ATP-binding cassette domain-containing protein, partial [Candidatus Methylomirabilota bacterium]